MEELERGSMISLMGFRRESKMETRDDELWIALD